MAETQTRPDRLYDYFNSIRIMAAKIKVLESRGEYLRHKASGSSSFRPYACGERDCTLQERRLFELLENNEMLRETVNEMMFRQEEATGLLARLKNERQRLILKDRFLCGMSWEAMENVHFYGERNLRMLAHKGMQALEGEYRRLILETEGRELP